VNPYYPIALRVDDRLVLVVGGGNVALRKVEALLTCGARVRVVAPEACLELEALAEEGRIELCARLYAPEDLDGVFLAIAATDSPAVNTAVSEDARARKILVNSVDRPDECDFITPASVRRGDLLISIFTGGKSPGLSRRIRERIEEVIGPEYAEFVALLGALRPGVMAAYATEQERSRVWRRLLDSDVLALLRAGRAAEAWERAREIAYACDPGGSEPPDRPPGGA